jgi:hypothetical protein
MISRRFFRVCFATLATLVASTTAQAQTVSTSCTTDTDCSHGFTCQAAGATLCPVVECAAADPNCVQPVCDPQIIRECQPGSCTTDSDCAAGMVCYAESAVSCPVAPDPVCADGKCVQPDVDAACTTVTAMSCVPQYDVPCHVDSDCGPGFTCVPDTTSECSGGGSAGSGSVGSSPPSVGEDGGAPTSTCTTTTLSTSSCQLNTIPCTTVSDCPSSTWTCEATAVSNIACAEPAIGPDGGSAFGGCEPGPPASMQCSPPYANLPGLGGGSTAVPNAAAVGDAGTEGTAATEGSSTPRGALASQPTAGCQLAPGGGSGGGEASFFALLGLVGWMRRRNR